MKYLNETNGKLSKFTLKLEEKNRLVRSCI